MFSGSPIAITYNEEKEIGERYVVTTSNRSCNLAKTSTLNSTAFYY